MEFISSCERCLAFPVTTHGSLRNLGGSYLVVVVEAAAGHGVNAFPESSSIYRQLLMFFRLFFFYYGGKITLA